MCDSAMPQKDKEESQIRAFLKHLGLEIKNLKMREAPDAEVTSTVDGQTLVIHLRALRVPDRDLR